MRYIQNVCVLSPIVFLSTRFSVIITKSNNIINSSRSNPLIFGKGEVYIPKRQVVGLRTEIFGQWFVGSNRMRSGSDGSTIVRWFSNEVFGWSVEFSHACILSILYCLLSFFSRTLLISKSASISGLWASRLSMWNLEKFWLSLYII